MDLLNATADLDRQGRLLIDGTVKSHTVVEFASGKQGRRENRRGPGKVFTRARHAKIVLIGASLSEPTVVMLCDRSFGTCLQDTMRMRQPYNLVNSKRWIKQKEHKKANVDQELEPKKRPSMQRAQRLARRK